MYIYNKFKNLGIIVFSLIIIFNSPLFSESVSEDFTGYAPSVRAEGMGGAFTALAEGSDGIYYNPAGLGFDGNVEISSSHKTLDFEQSIESTMTRFKIFNFGYTGLGYQRYMVENLVERDAAGTITGYFDNKEELFSLSQGFNFGEHLALGTTFFMSRHELLDANATGSGMHIGLILKNRDISFALVERNIGYKKEWRNSTTNPTENIDREMVASFAIKKKKNNFVFDFIYGENGEKRVRGGVESKLTDNITIRAGLDDSHSSFGIGLTHKNYRIDTSFTNGDLTDSYSAGITFFTDGSPIKVPHRKRKRINSQMVKKEVVKKNKKSRLTHKKNVIKNVKRFENNDLAQKMSEGRKFFIEGEYSKSCKKLEEYITGGGEDISASYLLGISLFKSGKKEASKIILKEALSINRNTPYSKYAEILVK